MDEFYKKYASDSLSFYKKPELGLLSDELPIDQIVSLFLHDQAKDNETKELRRSLTAGLINACKEGGLKSRSEEHFYEPRRARMRVVRSSSIVERSSYPSNQGKQLSKRTVYFIIKSDLKCFAKENSRELSENRLLRKWWGDDEPKIGRRDSQIKIILDVIVREKLDPMKIPEGMKKIIKNKCINIDSELFTEDSFKRAWTEANKRILISMEDKEKYL